MRTADSRRATLRAPRPLRWLSAANRRTPNESSALNEAICSRSQNSSNALQIVLVGGDRVRRQPAFRRQTFQKRGELVVTHDYSLRIATARTSPKRARKSIRLPGWK